MKHRISVRSLAEYATLSGDLFAALQSIDVMQDGIKGHQMWQSRYEGDFEREVPIKITETFGDLTLTIFGRADGLDRASCPPVVEEIKTTRLNPRSIGESEHPAHWAQAEIYAYMIAEQDAAPSVEVRLSYIHLNGDSNTYTRVLTAAELRERFLSYALPYVDWLKRLDDWKDTCLPSAQALQFPYDEYREGQRDMASAIYRSFRAKHNVMIEAPTGIGKTAAALFAALKAMGEGLTSRIFYLTARTTTRRAAEFALDRMRQRGLRVRSITLTAKDKLCPCPGTPCDPYSCARAMGYYDRSRDAIKRAMAVERLTRDEIERLAAADDLCPFEFQLDLSETCDVIICDYNYAFDPRVKLKRFFTEKTDSVLLIDEAHNLIERAREMLSASLSLSDFRAIGRELRKLGVKDGPLAEATARVIDTLVGLKDSYDRPCWVDEASEPLSEAIEIFLDAARPILGGQGALDKQLTELYFAALNYSRVEGEMKADHRVLYEPGERSLNVKLWCYQPATYLKRAMARVRGAALFSATLTPIQYYARMLGLDEDMGDVAFDLPSPFPEENLLTIKLPINTTFKQRELTAHAVAEAIAVMARGKRGNYLACFPSHAYLKLVGDILGMTAPDLRIVRQLPTMTEREREGFIRGFQPVPERTMVALIAMGGVFSEGVDLPGDLLSGAAIVGVGIPQLSLERAALSELLGDDGEGMHYAYTFPGLQKVLQAAGRVIRTENDRGVVLLIDERFFAEGYESLLPPHWNVKAAEQLSTAKAMIDHFWAH